MKFADTQARLAIALNDPIAEHAELMRSLREGSRGLAAEERKLARKAAAEGYPAIDWGPQGFPDLMRGRTGPNGGLDTTPMVLSGYLNAYLLECPHHQVAEQALATSYLPLREVMRQTPSMSSAERREQKVCTMTGQRFFAPALAAVLANPSLAARCYDVGVCSALGVAHLDFVAADEQAGPWGLPSTRTRSLFCAPAVDLASPAPYTRHFYPYTIGPLLALLQSGWAAKPVRARKRALIQA